MSKHFYHGSTKFFTALKPNSWVTSEQENAKIFAIPWSIEFIGPDGKLKEKAISQKNIPQDFQLFIYRITTEDIIKAETNLGKLEDWMWQTTTWARVELIEYYPSWHKLFGISSNKNEKNLDEEFESL